ncbi:uncharacterized protein [Branchiostoma lanceolatum]|uniref:uncharacterized protein n=1 Tax=Branchiostoma lanceolatum TaxID=7740 RepID=UPI00345142A6
MDNNLFFAIKVYFGEPRLREPEITDKPGSLYNYVMSVTLTSTLALLLGLLVHVTVRRLTWCPPLKFTREQAANGEPRESTQTPAGAACSAFQRTEEESPRQRLRQGLCTRSGAGPGRFPPKRNVPRRPSLGNTAWPDVL